MSNRTNRFRLQPFITLCGFLLIITLLGPMVAWSSTYYVSTSGKDSNSGTSTSQPFRTIAKGVKPLRPGDTLYIRGGTWTERIDLMTSNISGTSGGYIKIAGYPGEQVTIRYADVAGGYGPIKARGTRGYLIFENLILDGINMPSKTGWLIRDGNHHFILRNIEIKNFKSTGLGINANDIQVINCKIHDNISTVNQAGYRHYGIYFSRGSNGLIQGNQIYRNDGGGVQVYPGPVSNLVIRNNSIYSNNTMTSSPVGGIILQGTSSSSISSTKVYNNLVYRNGSASDAGPASGIHIGDYSSGTKVWNNTVYGNKNWGVVVGNKASSTVIQNTISYANGYKNYYSYSSGTTYANNVTADPKFVNPSANNFQLQSSSPAANRGVRLSSVPNDYRNIPRPKGSSYDIGGYENY